MPSYGAIIDSLCGLRRRAPNLDAFSFTPNGPRDETRHFMISKLLFGGRQSKLRESRQSRVACGVLHMAAGHHWKLGREAGRLEERRNLVLPGNTKVSTAVGGWMLGGRTKEESV
jgi:hypothetical protein